MNRLGVCASAVLLLALGGLVSRADAQEGNQTQQLRRGKTSRPAPPPPPPPSGGVRETRNNGRSGNRPSSNSGTKVNAGRSSSPGVGRPFSSSSSPGLSRSRVDYHRVAPNQYDEEIELSCADMRVCLVDELDAYFAWMLVRQTSIPWVHFVLARGDGLTWSAVLDRLGVESWEAYAALGEPEPAHASAVDFEDLTYRSLAKAHLAGVDLRRFSCDLPVVMRGSRANPSTNLTRDYRARDERARMAGGIDSVDEDIARRIEDETGWCFDQLLEAREFLGSWPSVARTLYISPFLFEASFGIEVETRWLDSRRRVDYPTEDQIREVVLEDRWPELTSR